MSDEYDLAKSSKKLGPLVPILKDKNGNIIDGFHRQNANPDWPTITVESVDSDAKLELARLATNFCRRKLEPSEIQNRLAFLVGKCGMKPEEIAEQTGISEATIYRHLPQELKPKGEAISEGRKEQVARATSTQDMVQCEYCKIATSDIQTEVVNSKPRKLCVRCQGNFVLAPERFTAFFRNVNGESKTLEERFTQKPEPAYKESWTQRKAQMSPGISKMEEDIALLLQEKGVHGVVQQREFCLLSTRPDFYFPQKNLAVYIDGPAHEGKEDRDQSLRDLLTKRHGVRVLSLPYHGEGKVEKDRIVAAIVEA